MRSSIFLQENKIHYKNYLLLLVICLLAYWPLTFGLFSVKNDAIHYFLPYRFNISEAIRNGEFPFWSPYVYLGNPLYGDMQSGAWNPVVWFFSLIGRYDISLFHYENLLYIFLGGVGMYKLTDHLVAHSHTALLIAASYMLSGFMLSGQLINWLAAAAFLPFVIHYYLKTLHTPSFGNAIKTGIALFFLLTAGYPSFFIITGYILLALFILALLDRSRNKEAVAISWKKFLLQQLVILIVFAGLALPAIVSFMDLLPYYQRGSGTTYADTIRNSFEWQQLLSLVFPSSIKANDIVSVTDVTCRNVYPGIFTLLVLVAFPPKLNRRNKLLIILAVFALLFSMGDATPVRKFCYNILPLMDTFRHPSQMRLFFLFAILLLAAPGIKTFLTTNLSAQGSKKIKIIAWIAAGILLLIIILAFINSSLLKQLNGSGFSGIRTTVKNIIENNSLADTIAVNGLIQLFFIAAFLLWLGRYYRHKKLFSLLWIANLFIMAQLILPVTFVSKTSSREINELIHASPKGFPTTGLDKPIGENSRDALDHFDKIALDYFYNRKIGISRINNSPSFLEEQDDFLKTGMLYDYVSSKPVIYLADTIVQLKDTNILNLATDCNFAFADAIPGIKSNCNDDDTSFIKKISANHFEIETQNSSASLLVLTQCYHHHWKVWIDGQQSKIYKTNISFMSTPLPPGKHAVVFKFCPSNTVSALWVMLAFIALLILVGTVSLMRQNNFRQKQ
ncbi:MAG TPA: YfhO family protein [Chitinophagaceae bacterium]|nr:YfhO family protein [Chitinophagaceae bacterium]